MKKYLFSCFVLLMAVLGLTGCSKVEYARSGGIIITPKELRGYIGGSDTVIVDMQAADDYSAQHVEGAVNIPVSSVLINLPVDNMLAPKGRIQTVMGEAGIDNNTLVIIYDEGKSMNASRLWWTLLVYGHENVKVVSGGLPAIIKEGIDLTNAAADITPKEFTANDRRSEFIVGMNDVLAQVNDPDANTILLDVRSNAEYISDGKIPGSEMYDYVKNFYKDEMFLNVQAIRINYLEAGIRPSNNIITYCRTSMRSACTFLALYNAGYDNIKMYDGAYLEWSASGNNPVDIPDGAKVSTSSRDSS